MKIRKRHWLTGALLTGGASLSMLTMAPVGYSAWSSSVPVAGSIATVNSIPAPTDVQDTFDSATGDINFTWVIPTGTDYNGSPLATQFQILGQESGSTTWTLIHTVAGNVDQYSMPATTKYAKYSIVTVDNGWLSSYNNTSTPSVGAPPVSGITSGGTLISTQDITYDGGLQTISVPSGTEYAVITAAGAGGGGGSDDDNTYGGGGDLITANVPISTSSLVVLVGGGGQTSTLGTGGGGGLSGVFTSTPSDPNALIIAGGGGGGANDDLSNLQSNGTNGSLSPILPYYYSDGSLGGAGFGGAGGQGDFNPGQDGAPFGTGGVSTHTWSGPGGFGGGASGGGGWGGGGGGAGYVGGQGGNGWSGFGAADDASGGQGGQSYVISKATHVQDSPGNGGTGGYSSNGGNGYVDISFYS
jgi:hypothetical protein